MTAVEAPGAPAGVTAGVGRTALLVAHARALEARRSDPLAVDPYAEYFVRAAPGCADWPCDPSDVAPGDPVWDRLAGYFALRTRVLDAHLLAAARAGTRQIVLLGAGLDSRAHRLPWPTGTTVWELDRPAVLSFKQQVLDTLPPSPPATTARSATPMAVAPAAATPRAVTTSAATTTSAGTPLVVTPRAVTPPCVTTKATTTPPSATPTALLTPPLATRSASPTPPSATPRADRRTVPVDLRADWTAALRRSGFDPARPTAWLAEGLFLYLPAEAELRIAAALDTLSAPGSTLAYEIKAEPENAAVRAHPIYTTARDRLGIDLLALFAPGPRPRTAEALTTLGWTTTTRTPFDHPTTRLSHRDPHDPLSANRWITATKTHPRTDHRIAG
ncbi:SAM-dependent methyltransferase [Streptomyces sp. NPDC047014]|uniref:SAM-dependent methyltransferase n=1 Tax=Streptomyces sp. NPDC047014 TaxID=3155736 RepID=UPI0033CF476F